MKSSYNKEDVTLLIKDLTGKVEAVSLKERDRLVAEGAFERSIMIKEYPASNEYLTVSWSIGNQYLGNVAYMVKVVAERIFRDKGNGLVLVSIIRAGIPVGILIKRYLKLKYGVDIPHYGVSLVKGLDPNAMKYILERHPADSIQFIDGWTGKGTVTDELVESAKQYKGVDASLAVLCDPIHVAKYAGCYEDKAVTSAPFNACCTGLVSITIFNTEQVGENDFHGAVYLEELEPIDKSQEFINEVCSRFDISPLPETVMDEKAKERIYEVSSVSEEIGVPLKFLNPGINEAARAILRRDLDRLLVSDRYDKEVEVIVLLAKMKGVKVEEYPLNYYKAISVAKK